MFKRFRDLIARGEHGQGLVEYALILMLASILVIFILVVFGESVKDIYCDIMIALEGTFGLPNVPELCEEGEATAWAISPAMPVV